MKLLYTLIFSLMTTAVYGQTESKVEVTKPKCYLTTVPTQPPIKSCDPNLIQRSLNGYDFVGMLRFKNSSQMEFLLIQPQQAGKIQTITLNFKSVNNLITTEPAPNCFITHEVEEGTQFRKEFFQNASPGCPQHIVNASKIATEELKSGRDKGFIIVNE